MSIQRTLMVRALAVVVLAVTACSDQTATGVANNAGLARPAAPSQALLPLGGIFSLATQLIATSGTTPLLARAWENSEGVQLNGYNVGAMWADPVAGKGWVMYDDNLGPHGTTSINHYWITSFTWPAETTDSTVIQHAVQSAVVEAVGGTRARTSVDDFGRTADAGTLSGIQQLVWDAAYRGDGEAVFAIEANKWAYDHSPKYTPGHEVKLLEVWITFDQVMYIPSRYERRVHGTYLMSVDGRRSAHAYCFANTEDTIFDFGFKVGYDIMHNAEKSLGLPIDPSSPAVATGDTIQSGLCPGAV